MKNTAIVIGAAALTALALTSCEVEKTQDMELPDVDVNVESGNIPDVDIVVKEEAKLPKVDVDAKGGKLPKFNVDVADVDVKLEEKTIKVPTVDVTLPEDTDDPSDLKPAPKSE